MLSLVFNAHTYLNLCRAGTKVSTRSNRKSSTVPFVVCLPTYFNMFGLWKRAIVLYWMVVLLNWAEIPSAFGPLLGSMLSCDLHLKVSLRILSVIDKIPSGSMSGFDREHGNTQLNGNIRRPHFQGPGFDRMRQPRQIPSQLSWSSLTAVTKQRSTVSRALAYPALERSPNRETTNVLCMAWSRCLRYDLSIAVLKLGPSRFTPEISSLWPCAENTQATSRTQRARHPLAYLQEMNPRKRE